MNNFYMLVIAILIAITFSCDAQNNKKKIDYYNAIYHNIEFDGRLYEKLEIVDGEFAALDRDINSKEFSKEYFERSGEKFISGQTELPYWAFSQEGYIDGIFYTDLNTDKTEEVIISFTHSYPGGSGHSDALFILAKDNPKLEPIAHLQLGSRGLGGIAPKSENCNKCRGIEVKDGKLILYVYDGTYALDRSSYRIITYELKKNELKRIQTSKKYEVN